MDLFLVNFKKNENNIENKKLQSRLSKTLSEKIFDFHYGIKVVLEHNSDGSPYFKNSKINISISHTDGIIAFLFSENKSGVDIEYIKERNYEKILKRYNINKCSGKTEFYQLWTDFEARYKGKSTKTGSFIYKNCVCSYCYDNDAINIFEVLTDENNPEDIKTIKSISDTIIRLDTLKNKLS